MAPDTDREPTLVLSPPDDDAFRSLAGGLVATGVGSAAELEARLRATYPRAAVRPRDLAGERMQIWYVYRDGHWVRPGS
ncbi:MAG TPA: hypothetical protein VFP22_05615 [Candidatus Limnocylindrales bacterium]|nr:hypothetical protein [Candidatus Limnocylindrales bacterium]